MTIIVTPHGRPAYEALTRAVLEAKDGNPLTPVHVIVPSEPIGVAARRWLARHGNCGGPGIAGLTFLTLYRLAELLAGPEFAKAGKRPVTTPILVGAIRAALAKAPGLFADVSRHPATAQSLACASRELRSVDAETQRAISGRAIAADVLRLHHAAWRRLAPHHYDETDLQETAIATLAPGNAASLPPIVVFLPRELTPGGQRFLAHLAAVTSVTVVLGLTDGEVDRRLLTGVQQALPSEPPVAAPPLAEPIAASVLCTTDADDEVRAVVAAVAERLRADTSGYRIAIVYGSAIPYARIVHEHLADARIAFYGRGVVPGTEARYGRAIRGLLALADRNLRRAEVITWLDDAPVHDAWSLRWDRASRKAGVVDGDDWQERLATLHDARQREADELALSDDPDDQARAAWARNDADTATELRTFMMQLRDDLHAIDTAADWAVMSDTLITLWDRLFPEAQGDGADRELHARIRRRLRELRGLEAIGVPPSRQAVREILELELASDLRRIGTIGTGVMVGSLADAAGQEFDAVYVLGLAEGITPAIAADDPLLAESVRAATNGVLPTWRDRQNAARRDLLAVLTGAGWAQLSFPRGDLRSGTDRVPSRWLLPTLQAHLGDVQATDWHRRVPDQSGDAVIVRASYDAGIRTATPVTESGYWQRRALADPGSVDPLPVTIQRDRVEGRFTRFTGLVGDTSQRRSIGSSATALQAFFTCPHHYFVRYILGVRELDDPDDVIEMSALDQGSLQHSVLETFINEGRDELDFGKPWPQRLVERLDEIIDDHFVTAQRSAPVGLRTPWEQVKRRMRADLRRWVDADNQMRAQGNWKPLAAELTFAHLPVPLPDGTTLSMRGSVDRVDIDPAGSLHVIDYKTGGARKYSDLSPDNPIGQGRFVQLPLYALAARTAGLATAGTTVAADFWFISAAGGNQRHGYQVTDEIMAVTENAFAVVASCHRAGWFPPRPKSHSRGYDCPTCTADGLPERMTAEAFEVLLADPLLTDYARVITDAE